MVASDRALATSYRLSIVTISITLDKQKINETSL